MLLGAVVVVLLDPWCPLFQGCGMLVSLAHAASGSCSELIAWQTLLRHHNAPCPQALLDVYTIQREIGRLDNFKIGLIGDLVGACLSPV